MAALESTGIDEASTRLPSDIIPEIDRDAWRDWNALLDGLMPSAPGDVWSRFTSMTDAALLQLERIYDGTMLAGIVSGTSERRRLCRRVDKDPAAEAVSGSTDNNAKAAMPIPKAVNTLRRLRASLLKGVIEAGMHGELPGGRYLQDGQLAALTPAHWQEVYGSYGAGAGSGGYPKLWDDLLTLTDSSLHVFDADGRRIETYRSIVFVPDRIVTEPNGERVIGEPARVPMDVLVAFLRWIGPKSEAEHIAAAQECFRLVSRDEVRAARTRLHPKEKGKRGRPLN